MMNSGIGARGWVDRAARWLVAAVFAAAAVPKLLEPADFAALIGMYGILPEELLGAAAVLLPLVELTTSVGLLVGRRWSIPLAAGQLLVFIGVLSYGLHLGLDVDCGCFGSADPEHGATSGLREARLRDAILLAPLLVSWRCGRT